MTLLPLAGWAQISIADADITIGSATLSYTGKATKPAITSVGAGDFDELHQTMKFYDSADNELTANKVKNVGNYKVSIVGDGVNFTGETKKVAFAITKVPMVISVKDVEKTYGAEDPISTAFEYTVVSGFVGDDDKNSVIVTIVVPGENSRAVGEHVGTYNYTGITATSQNYDVTVQAQPKLKINQATLTVTHDPIVINFGEPNPNLNPADFTIDGWVGFEKTGVEGYLAARTAAITFTSASYTQPKTDANADKTGILLGGKEAYECNVTGITLNSNDYKLSFAGVAMLIKQVELKNDATLFTFTMTDAEKTYNGTVQKPTYTIVYKANNYTLKNTDYTVTFGTGNSKAAANYVATVDAVAGGNFYTTAAFAKAEFNYSIAQRNLYVQAADQTKVYDGNAHTLTDLTNPNKFEFNGIADADADKTLAITAGSVAYPEGTTDAQKKNVGEFKVTPDVTITLKDAGANDYAANYKIVALATGTYKITARPLTITAKPQKITFGNPAPAFASTDTYIHVEKVGGKKIDGTTDVAAGEGAISDAEVTAILAKLNVGLKQEYNVAGSWNDGIVVSLKSGESLSNYTPVCNPGKYTIEGGTYTIIAKNITKVYGADYTLGYTTTGEDPAVAVDYEVWKDGVELSTKHPENVGTYDIKIKKNDAYKPSTNYSGIDYVDGKLTITPKAITITPKAVTLQVGAKEADLKTYGAIEEIEGKKQGDVIGYVLKFNSGAGDGQIPAAQLTSGALNTADATYNKGIKVELVESTNENPNANANYTIDVTATAVLKTYAANTLVLNLDGFDLEKIKDAEAACKADATKKYNVAVTIKRAGTIKGKEYKWEKYQWNTLILPFPVTVGELSREIGYAVVNVYDQTNTKENNLAFKLTMSEIPANTPILLKTDDDIPDGTVLEFVDKVISYDQSKMSQEAKNGISFRGTYKGVTISSETPDYKAYLADKARGIATEGESYFVNPFACYIDLGEGGEANLARELTITVEDIDGTVTTLGAIKAEGSRSIDGWYTVNGVKLQSAPTQKGIYINNGKKVVIK